MQYKPETTGDQDHGHFASESGTYLAGGVSRAFNKGHSSLSVIHPHSAIAPDNSETLRHLSFKATVVLQVGVTHDPPAGKPYAIYSDWNMALDSVEAKTAKGLVGA